VPKPSQRRRTEETRGGFKLAVQKIMRRVHRKPPPTEAERIWLSETMDWLQLWADSEAMSDLDAASDPTRPDGSNDIYDFSLHL
jgi:hypothetical protein